MAIRETLTASPAALAEVFGTGKRYAVPPFQRDYAWEETEWSELWADLLELHKAATSDRDNHYLGALVLQLTSRRLELNIIDGQQRLVTLSLLALAVIGRVQALADQGIETEQNLDRVRLLRERFVSTRDSAFLQYRSRLSLNDHDNPFYQTYLVQGIEPTRPNTLKGSEARLYKAHRYFHKKIEELLGANATGAHLGAFLEDTVASRIRFIEIQVEDDETAFAVFETLNARGVALGTADLLKNFVFAVAAKGGKSDLDQAKIWWNQILLLVPMDQVASFLFHKLAGQVADLREKRVFSEVKRLVPAKLSVFTFLRDLKDAAELYAALDDPNSEFWCDYPDARREVRILELLRVEQCRPVLLAALPKLADRPDKIARLLHSLVIISLRATVARVNTGDRQLAYQSAAIRIESGELKSPSAIVRALKDVTPSDDDFKAAFGQLAIDPKGPRKRLLRYILGELEAAFGGTVIDFDASDATVEHILPENPAGGWESFSPEDRARDTTRLGNLTPLEYSLNKALGSAYYDRKRTTYQQSRYRMTSSIVQSEWNPSAVRARQLQMAEKAVSIWRIQGDD